MWNCRVIPQHTLFKKKENQAFAPEKSCLSCELDDRKKDATFEVFRIEDFH